ncbi:MAG: Permease of the drug/metabolite transporter superfamily [Chthoniobacter sp.]|nr:Permease of the drug/metabolite transporter superfamily [Chthoniobacter sp.]
MRSVAERPVVPVLETLPRTRIAAPLGLVIAAFAAVYLIWGSTYLGIRLAIDSIPPFLMAGTRFVLAGAILYSVMRLRGAPRPSREQWLGATIVGGLLLLAGNGGVSWAQQTVPSGIAALMVAATPLWIMLVDWLRPNGTRPTASILAGLFVGFIGVGVIVASRSQLGHRLVEPLAAAVLVFATVSWALGSVYSRHAQKPASALLGVSMQMLTGGALQLLAGVLLGETRGFDPARITATSAWALVYLTLIGSLVGFTAYVWLLQVSTPARVSTYAYVNPLIAVLLGHLVLNEEVPGAVALAGALILAAVILITRKATVTTKPTA